MNVNKYVHIYIWPVKGKSGEKKSNIENEKEIFILTQDVHSDRRKRRRIRPETTIKRLKSCRKRPPFLIFFHRFKAVIRHSRLRNGLHRTRKRRRFMPFPSNNGVPHWHRIFAVYYLKTAVFIRLRVYLLALKSSEI
jgi:hypothetical protein